MIQGDIERKIVYLSECEELRVSLFELIDSTNTEARRQAERGMSVPALIISREQSNGRGRMGRSFYSPKATGLYMTVLLKASSSVKSNVLLTTAASVAVAKAIDVLCGVKTEIKWVNDVYLGGKKICGILCESFEANGERYVALGIGLNLYTESFPKELSETADSLYPSPNMNYDFAAEIFKQLYSFYGKETSREMIEYYRERSFVIGKKVAFIDNGETYFGTAENVDDYGRLIVLLRNGEKRILSSGEISLRLDKD